MKITCAICKTEYSLDRFPMAPVKCAVCGHVWVAHRQINKGMILRFFAAICALIAAAIFSFVVVVNHQAKIEKSKPLLAKINKDSIRIINGEDGINNIFVSGTVTNQSNSIYGIPDLLISVSDKQGRVIHKQKFMPPATLLEPGMSIDFTNILQVVSIPVSEIKALEVELIDKRG